MLQGRFGFHTVKRAKRFPAGKLLLLMLMLSPHVCFSYRHMRVVTVVIACRMCFACTPLPWSYKCASSSSISPWAAPSSHPQGPSSGACWTWGCMQPPQAYPPAGWWLVLPLAGGWQSKGSNWSSLRCYKRGHAQTSCVSTRQAH